MKEATGELNMTVVTLIAIAAVAALFYFAVWPLIQRMLIQNTCNMYGSDYKAVQGDVLSTNGNAQVSAWCCCKGNKQACTESDDDCIVVKKDGEEPAGD